VWEFSHPEVVDDQERDRGQVREIGFAGPVQRRVGELLEEHVRFAIADTVTLLDDRAADGLRQVAFPRPWWPEEKRVLALRDEAPGGQLVDQGTVHLLVEIKVKGVE
jgi:hypothetical protein